MRIAELSNTELVFIESLLFGTMGGRF